MRTETNHIRSLQKKKRQKGKQNNIYRVRRVTKKNHLKMVNKCIVKGCIAYKNVNPSSSMHFFPKETLIRSKWIQFCEKPFKSILRYHRICSNHFELNCFEPRTDIRKLKWKATPTLNRPVRDKKGKI